MQIQSPARVFIYWTLREDPDHILRRALRGVPEHYTLVVKLINVSGDSEEIFPIDSSGSAWFDVDSNSEYRAEIGLYDPDRPFIRIMTSGSVKTPRRRPSPRISNDSEWMISTDGFARVLSISGFQQDAFDAAVAAVGDPDARSRSAFGDLSDRIDDLDGVSSEELRRGLFFLSAGLPLESLRWRIDASVFRLLQQHAADLSPERAAAAVRKHFGVDIEDSFEFEERIEMVGSAFLRSPRRLKKMLRADDETRSSFSRW
jgi:hypothetical protein